MEWPARVSIGAADSTIQATMVLGRSFSHAEITQRGTLIDYNT